MKTQKLGRGLDALLGEIGEAYENELASKDSIVELNIKDIRTNPYQPRKYFDEDALYELSESIKSSGLIQPIVVTQDIDGYVLVAGERRLRASKLAKLKSIKAVVLSADEHKMREFALIENIQREDLNSIELAHSYAELIKLHSLTQDELAEKIHKSRTHITNTLRLLQLSAKTQKAIIEKKITTGHAKVLVGLDEQEQQLMVDTIVGQKLSVRDVEKNIKNFKNSSAITPFERKKDRVNIDFKEAIARLQKCGFRVRGSTNALSVEFSDHSELEKFLDYFNNSHS